MTKEPPTHQQRTGFVSHLYPEFGHTLRFSVTSLERFVVVWFCVGIRRQTMVFCVLKSKREANTYVPFIHYSSAPPIETKQWIRHKVSDWDWQTRSIVDLENERSKNMLGRCDPQVESGMG